MPPKNTPPTPGARESNAGDRFHVLWAARRAVQLLNPRSDLQRVFMEGLSPVDVSANEIDDDFFLGVDLSEYYAGEKFETASRIELSQLKYSTRHPNKAWTTSRLCAAKNTQGTDSVIRRLADIFKGFRTHHSREDVLKKLCIRLVSNQPVATELLCALKSAQDLLTTTPMQAQQLLKQLSEDDRNQIQPFQNRANLSRGWLITAVRGLRSIDTVDRDRAPILCPRLRYSQSGAWEIAVLRRSIYQIGAIRQSSDTVPPDAW